MLAESANTQLPSVLTSLHRVSHPVRPNQVVACADFEAREAALAVIMAAVTGCEGNCRYLLEHLPYMEEIISISESSSAPLDPAGIARATKGRTVGKDDDVSDVPPDNIESINASVARDILLYVCNDSAVEYWGWDGVWAYA